MTLDKKKKKKPDSQIYTPLVMEMLFVLLINNMREQINIHVKIRDKYVRGLQYLKLYNSGYQLFTTDFNRINLPQNTHLDLNATISKCPIYDAQLINIIILTKIIKSQSIRLIFSTISLMIEKLEDIAII